jgi:molybdenum cofactor cytidylyltransferase
MTAHAPLHAIVLAAGAATRFGSAKQLLPLDGEPLLLSAVRRAAQVVGNRVLVVLGARAPELAPLLEGSPAQLVINPEWREGIGSSIRAGVASLPQACGGVLLLLADQAALTVEDLQALVDAWRREPSRIAAARYDDTVGVPALLPRSCFPELLQLQGDTGARKLLRQDPGRVLPVFLPHAALDIDTPQDWESFQGRSTSARTR